MGNQISCECEPDGLRIYRMRQKIQDTLQGHIYLLTTDPSESKTNSPESPPIIIKKTSKILVKKGLSRHNYRIPENYHEELRILKYLSSFSDINNYGICRVLPDYIWNDNNNYYYGMEYCYGGDLFEYLKKVFITDKYVITRIKRAKIYFKQIVRSVYYLHSKGIAHRDLSLENIMLYDKNNKLLRLIDFGVAYDRRKNNNSWISQQRVGKLKYMAPEVFNNLLYDTREADIWSLGVMLFIMLCGFAPFNNENNQKKHGFNSKSIKCQLQQQSNMLNDEIIDLLNRIFKYENERITMDEIIAHSFVDLENELKESKLHEMRYLIKKDITNDSSTKSRKSNSKQQQNRIMVLNRVIFTKTDNYLY